MAFAHGIAKITTGLRVISLRHPGRCFFRLTYTRVIFGLCFRLVIIFPTSLPTAQKVRRKRRVHYEQRNRQAGGQSPRYSDALWFDGCFHGQMGSSLDSSFDNFVRARRLVLGGSFRVLFFSYPPCRQVTSSTNSVVGESHSEPSQVNSEQSTYLRKLNSFQCMRSGVPRHSQSNPQFLQTFVVESSYPRDTNRLRAEAVWHV